MKILSKKHEINVTNGGTIVQVEQKDVSRVFGISQYNYKYTFTIVQMGLQFAKLLL